MVKLDTGKRQCVV